jgi:hypothetical protein
MKNHPLTIVCFIVLVSIFAAAACGDGEGNGHDADADTDVIHETTDTTPDTPPDTPPDTVPDEDADTGDVPADDAPGELTVEEFCGALVQFICDYITGCCTEDEAGQFFNLMNCDNPAPSIAECMDDFTSLVDAGTVVLNPAALVDCRSRMNELVGECPDVNVFMAESELVFGLYCHPVLEGQTPAGQPCSEDEECAPGTFCDYGGGESSCTPYRGAAEACMDNMECGPTMACIEERCGEVSGEGGACDEQSDCEGALWCDESNHCAPMGAAGTPCMDDFECAGACEITTEPGQCVDACNGL